MTKPDHYEILNLPFPNPGLSKTTLKLAYHKALLKHHPDKSTTPTPAVSNLPSPSPSPSTSPSTPPPSTKGPASAAYTIDQITSAFKVLSDPALRPEYDRSLRLSRSRQNGASGDRNGDGDTFHIGLEIVDLEDLTYDEAGEDFVCWFRGCRCGDERGFLVTEEDLEREVESGEIVVGCRGCSLWVKVVFGVEEGDGEGGKEKG